MSMDPQRSLDIVALKALAHPLRTQLFDALMPGPATASQLGEQLGESSGSTSYHLRQLAKHGFIEEDSDRGNARERWWRIRSGSNSLESENLNTPAGREAIGVFADEWLRLRYRAAADFHARRRAGLDPEWAGNSEEMTSGIVLTPDETAEMAAEVLEVLDRWAVRMKGRERPGPGTRLVEVQFRAFPRHSGARTQGQEPDEAAGA